MPIRTTLGTAMPARNMFISAKLTRSYRKQLLKTCVWQFASNLNGRWLLWEMLIVFMTTTNTPQCSPFCIGHRGYFQGKRWGVDEMTQQKKLEPQNPPLTQREAMIEHFKKIAGTPRYEPLPYSPIRTNRKNHLA
jgi:hypothetical protein